MLPTRSTTARQKPKTEAEPQFVWVVRALRSGWPLVLAAAILGAGTALLWSKSQPKVYETGTLVEFDPDVVRPMGSKQDPMMGWSAIWDTREYYETQYRIMMSDRVLSQVVHDLGLQTDADFWGRKPEQPMPLDVTLDSLRARVKIVPEKGSRLVYIRVEDTLPAQCQKLADAVAHAYIDQNLAKMVSSTQEARDWLSSQMDAYEKKLTDTENKLQQFKRDNDLPSSNLEEVSRSIRSTEKDYNDALTHLRIKKDELASRHAELSKISPDTPDQVPASELLGNAFLQTLRTQYQTAVKERKGLVAEGRGENHPLVKNSDEKISQTKADLINEIHNIQGALARELRAVESDEGRVNTRYLGTRKQAVDLNAKEIKYRELDRERLQTERLYALLLEQTKEADLRRLMNTNNIRLQDLAPLPKVPVRPRVPANTGMGLLAGFVVGIALALGRERLDRSLKTPAEAEERLGVTCIGILPEVEGAEKLTSTRRAAKPTSSVELTVHEHPLSGAAEASRAMRTNLMFMNPDSPYTRIIVTSPAPSEGKTTVACSLAITLAQGGAKVVIVDCDLRRPRIHRIFDRVGDVGLTNVLLGEATLDDVALPTHIPNLSCVPSGATPPNPADLLASARFRQVLSELSERFDRVIIDTPPVTAVADAMILSKLVDGVVFVVRAFRTSYALGRQGIKALSDVDAPIVGTVLNAVSARAGAYDYYQYYRYRGGYGPRSDNSPNDRKGDATPPAAPPN